MKIQKKAKKSIFLLFSAFIAWLLLSIWLNYGAKESHLMTLSLTTFPVLYVIFRMLIPFWGVCNFLPSVA